jgi:hypothetical protein
MNDYEGSELRGGCRVLAACYLSHPREVVKRGYLSTQNKVYANRLGLEALCHEHLCRAFFMQRHLPHLPRHTSSPTETNGVTREYERGMMHTPEFCQQSSDSAHGGSRHVVSAARCSYGQLVPAKAHAERLWLAVPPYRRCLTRRIAGTDML